MSAFLMPGRTAGCNIPQEPCEYRIEVSWRFPESSVPQSVQAMAAGFPQIGIRDGIEVVEVDEGIPAAVDHGERDQTAFHDQTLIHSFSGTRRLEEPLAKAPVGARNRIPEEWLGRFTENTLNKSVYVCLRQLLLPRDASMR